MPTKPPDLTAELHAGPNAEKPAAFTEWRGLAWRCGRHMAREGLPKPIKATAGGSLFGSMIRFGIKSLSMFGRPAILGPTRGNRDSSRNNTANHQHPFRSWLTPLLADAQFQRGKARAKSWPTWHFIRRSALLFADVAPRKAS
jgi:hypothetical protein